VNEDGGKTHVDELDVRHLLRQRREHLVDELRVTEDDLLDTARIDEVLEVTRDVGSTEEGGEDVHVVGVLEDLRAELETGGVAVKGANDGDAVTSFGVELDLVKSSDVRSSNVKPGNDEHNRLFEPREMRFERRLPADHLELTGGTRGDVGKAVGLDEGGVLLLDTSFERRETIDEHVPPARRTEGGGVSSVPVERLRNRSTPVTVLQERKGKFCG
jgi:hypothetical protein